MEREVRSKEIKILLTHDHTFAAFCPYLEEESSKLGSLLVKEYNFSCPALSGLIDGQGSEKKKKSKENQLIIRRVDYPRAQNALSHTSAATRAELDGSRYAVR